MKRSVKKTFLHTLEILAIVLSFLGRNAIARFLAAKLGLDVVVEVTSRFGADAGHRLSSFVALLIAEPRLIAVIVTAVIIVLHVISWIISRLFRRGRRPRHDRPPVHDPHRLQDHGRPDAPYPGDLPEKDPRDEEPVYPGDLPLGKKRSRRGRN